ncbi:YgjV family protein [Alteromonas sp. 1_MG-2023]|uniref:YgjV family protein n=1 Tax=Alteromonas sp. 1_MG-2023 TaxID=3062669 RepID=UPI0026E2044E|nr:YgjV family protein [Alteromonas sp. 1_MG-2023]MDO6568223.1 YgjV family protein [Alteromonas sp. 1_MG-2023]
MSYVAEGFGALAVVFNFVGYKQNKVDRYLFISAFGLLCLSTHFFMLDAMAAGVGTLLAGLRNFIAIKNRSVFVLIGFLAANIGFMLYEWFVLQHSWIIFIAYASALIFTVGSVVLRETKSIRRYFLLAETLGLIYAILVGSIFGTIFNISNIVSILTKIHSEKKKT